MEPVGSAFEVGAMTLHAVCAPHRAPLPPALWTGRGSCSLAASRFPCPELWEDGLGERHHAQIHVTVSRRLNGGHEHSLRPAAHIYAGFPSLPAEYHPFLSFFVVNRRAFSRVRLLIRSCFAPRRQLVLGVVTRTKHDESPGTEFSRQSVSSTKFDKF